MKCSNCRYWNTILEDCVACSKIKKDVENIKRQNLKYGLNKNIPEIPQRNFNFNTTSENLMRNGYCKFYKFSVSSIINWLDCLVNRGRN